ncbi:hypothetical protein BDZ91DRAFT_848625 [Kalaharituber pfeilii]|nr:hypothetical protein BDZ91DRAFT_848625 [Kalaharituber pfeilii]
MSIATRVSKLWKPISVAMSPGHHSDAQTFSTANNGSTEICSGNEDIVDKKKALKLGIHEKKSMKGIKKKHTVERASEQLGITTRLRDLSMSKQAVTIASARPNIMMGFSSPIDPDLPAEVLRRSVEKLTPSASKPPGMPHTQDDIRILVPPPNEAILPLGTVYFE